MLNYFLKSIFVFLCSHLSTVLGNKFDHGAEAIVPTLFNLVPNSAKVMATSGCAAIRFIIRVGSFLLSPFPPLKMYLNTLLVFFLTPRENYF